MILNPLVSIIVPCYNQAQYLDAALQSVLDQTYADWECIIVNDGSLDNTAAVAKNWIAKDSRFFYLYKGNGGLSSARNAGLVAAKGAYVQFLDSDDCIAKTKLELSLQHLDLAKSKEVKVAITNFRMFVDNPLNTFAPFCNLNEQLFHFESLLYQWEEFFTIPIHCGLFEASLFKSFRFPENLKAKEDWVMWVSLFYQDCEAVFINEALALYRRNPDSMSTTKNMLPDFLSAHQYFKNILSEEEFNKLSVVLISRGYRASIYYKTRLNSAWQSNTYKSGNFIKKFLRRVGILNLAKTVLKKMLQSSCISKHF
jgi:glycosyltransferase involved in cell wall biosynthesis